MLYIGCYTAATGGNGVGVTALRQEASGALTQVGELAMTSPSWLTRHPTAPVLYATNESADGAITTVELDGLTAVDTVESGGADPCHLEITAEQRFLLCANYSSGSLAVFGLATDGRITGRTDLVTHEGSGPDADRQEAAHVHMAVPLDTPQGTIVSAVDLGTDEIRGYRLSDTGELAQIAVSAMPPGTGPRQLVRRPGTDLAYVAGELAGTLVTVREGPAGTFTPIGVERATLAPYGDDPAAGPNYVAHLVIAGERLYLSNRGPDCVTEFDLTGESPKAVADHPSGAFPRHFSLVDGVCHVAAQRGDAIVSFPPAGGAATRFATGSPTCVIPG
ncbi:MAG: beta-propeller fold lactonase family protein [Actinophytocola sp.]|uniref:lactonase family protein n=1 Tax=Actinophytocola sp. TaxID=1872138 RepID=UPI0013236F02|nr:beta-propeller fold lactonase family protein [Actinophytocola sp.]MPZ85476.1 beta-propeller fold lactonase family protein [Actinophytocola sp.]